MKAQADNSLKPHNGKTELREELEEQMRQFLHRGGKVEKVARGISGRDGATAPLQAFRSYAPQPREERTYVPEVVAAIESRRRKPAKRKTESRTRKRPGFTRRVIYDDFGEPLRYEWVESQP